MQSDRPISVAVGSSRRILNLNKIWPLVVALVIAKGTLSAQENPCSNPQAARIGIFVMSPKPKTVETAADKIQATRFAVESQMSDELTSQLGRLCFIHDSAVFSDPANYPTLKGSTVIQISATPSLRNDGVSAIAVEVLANQGPYFEQNIPLVTIPILIERQSDYAIGAKMVQFDWNSIVKSLAKHTAKHD
jgi:hypothetical protein